MEEVNNLTLLGCNMRKERDHNSLGFRSTMHTEDLHNIYYYLASLASRWPYALLWHKELGDFR